MISSNSELPARFDGLVSSHTAQWVMEKQPIDWRPRTWKTSWQTHQLPCPHVLDELEAEITSNKTIRRSFVLSTYRNRSATELFIAVMAWGSGTGGRTLARIRNILSEPDVAEKKLHDTVTAVREKGAAAGYKAYFDTNRISQLNVAFVTKLLYFAGYENQTTDARPLIYDSRVATAITRLPGAPLLPGIDERITTSSYESYCAWAESIAAERRTEPVVIEWALFTLGGDIRDELRR